MNDPLELLRNKNDRQPSYLNDKWNPLIASLMGLGASLFINYGTRRPLMSAVQRHAILAGLGLGIGVWVDKGLQEHTAKRDAVLRHYIELHPDDFPPKERTKYADILESWVPVR